MWVSACRWAARPARSTSADDHGAGAPRRGQLAVLGASLLGEISGDDSFSADLSAFQNIGASYDESALPENDVTNPEDEIGGQAL